jgi:hypothetical protein
VLKLGQIRDPPRSPPLASGEAASIARREQKRRKWGALSQSSTGRGRVASGIRPWPVTCFCRGMTDSLSTYVHDHIAGSRFALELLKRMRDRYAGDPLGTLAAELLVEIEQDRMVAENLAERLGSTRTNPVKEAVAWVGDRAGQLKLRVGDGDLGTFEALETLALGILGKLSLWRALSMLPANDERLQGFDLEGLATRALTQHARVESCRLKLARTIFAPSEASHVEA